MSSPAPIAVTANSAGKGNAGLPAGIPELPRTASSLSVPNAVKARVIGCKPCAGRVAGSALETPKRPVGSIASNAVLADIPQLAQSSQDKI